MKPLITAELYHKGEYVTNILYEDIEIMKIDNVPDIIMLLTNNRPVATFQTNRIQLDKCHDSDDKIKINVL